MRERPPVGILVVLCVIASAIGIVLGLTIHWFPVEASSQADEIDTLYNVMVIVSVPIFVGVAGVILFSVWRFRMRPGEELMDGPPIHGSTRLEIAWTAAPSVLVIGLAVYALIVLADINKKPAREMQVDVTGQQFAWSYSYPASATGGRALSSDTLELPLGESVQFNMVSKDVIHAFWVPAFRIQEDVVPGITTHYRITPTRLGSYDIVCNELCGLGHAVMRSRVTVVSPARFQQWLAGQAKAAAAGGASAAAVPGGHA